MTAPSDDGALTEPQLRQRAEAKKRVADAMVEDRMHCREAWIAAGFAVEFALKALIMRRNDWATWPTVQSRPDLHVHTLKPLMKVAGVDLVNPPKAMRASLRQVLDWERRHDYHGSVMPRKAARSMRNAAFGQNGVVEWLNQQ